MPMVYVSKKSLRLLNELLEYLQRNTSTPGRVLKADVIHAALEDYAKKLGVRVK
jgi:hypothetical protein